jgi:hypothetical protein
VAKPKFPTVPIGEWTPMRPNTAPGLFAYRHLQADSLLEFPDMGGGDMSAEQRRESLLRMVSLRRPLAAVVLFLNTVALEDFIRDLGARLADAPGLESHFSRIAELLPRPVQNPRPFGRLDKDPAPLLNWPEVNALYSRVLDVEPIPAAQMSVLHDLALVRHIVAHHAALVRPVDAPRFQHWEVVPSAQLNPPTAFVKEMATLLYRTGRSFEDAIRKRIFSVVLDASPIDWYERPPDLIGALIELFNFFGKLLSDNEPPLDPTMPEYETQARVRSDRNRTVLTRLCLDELREERAV